MCGSNSSVIFKTFRSIEFHCTSVVFHAFIDSFVNITDCCDEHVTGCVIEQYTDSVSVCIR